MTFKMFKVIMAAHKGILTNHKGGKNPTFDELHKTYFSAVNRFLTKITSSSAGNGNVLT